MGGHVALLNDSTKVTNASKNVSDLTHVNLLHKIHRLDTNASVNTSVKASKVATGRGNLEVNGPLPADFGDRFAKEVSKATGCKPEDVRVLNTSMVQGEAGVDEIVFEAPPDVIKAVQQQAADPDSKLATGPLRIFLIEKAEDADADAESEQTGDSATDKTDGAAKEKDGKE